MSAKALSSYILTNKYANHVKDARRRETWVEATSRVFGMHRKQYASVAAAGPYIREAEEAFGEMLALGSQRVLQYAGTPVERKNSRGYNCVSSFIDRPRMFQESFWLLLCGCGTGFSTQWHHVAKLPPVIRPSSDSVVFAVPDTIEGWADALGALLSSYFQSDDTPFPELRGKHVVFDYDQIRPEGSPISSGSGKAPGPEPLRHSLDAIRKLMDRVCQQHIGSFTALEGWTEAQPLSSEALLLWEQKKLQPIDAYDIIMHASDAVLAGGVRRSASIAIFSPTDVAMSKAKTGSWFGTNAQRARSNNSALLLRGQTSREQFAELIKQARSWGEPGFYWSDSTEQMPNPCQPSWAPILTRGGLSTMGALKEGDEIWSETGWVKVTKKWSTGVKPVFRYRTTAGMFIGTVNHRIVSGGEKIEVGEAEAIDRLAGPACSVDTAIDDNDVMDGLVIGDGTVHRAGGGVFLVVGKDDEAYASSGVGHLMADQGYGGNETLWRVTTSVKAEELPHTYNRRIPARFMYGDTRKARGFLRGLYSANGSVVGGRVTLKTSSPQVRDDVQVLLSSLGIPSYYTTNRAHDVQFENGIYECRESYDVNITAGANIFARAIGFIQPDKTERLMRLMDKKNTWTKPKVTFDIVGVEALGEEEVFDITVDNEPHTYWTGGCNVSNCVEASFWPVDEETKETGWQFCNLSIINMAQVRTKEQFRRAARAAAIMGTLQAGYTNFDYLGPVSERITRREALLGVSMTGMMEAPDLAFDPETLQEMAKVVLDTNAELAAILGIQPAARATLLKPEGTSSLMLETCSGIHPHHAKRYLRRVQANQHEAPARFFQELNPRAVEKSAWGRSGTDLVVSFCVEAPDGSTVAADVSSARLLSLVKLVKENWVDAGKRPEACTQTWLSHNVSNTIYVGDDEWEATEQYIFDNQHVFAGIALLSRTGDLDYQQAPFCEVLTAEEIVNKYGAGAMMASGLIVDGVRVFNNDLWVACDTAMGCPAGIGVNIKRQPEPDNSADTELLKDQREWARRAEQFAQRYFAGDMKAMAYCLKHVHNLKLWHDLNRETVDVDYTRMVEDVDGTNFSAEAACAGGACSI